MKPLIGYAETREPKKPTADGERFPQRRQPEYVTWFNAQKYPCVAQGSPVAYLCSVTLENMHLRSRGAGGQDVGNLVKGCNYHHRRLHSIGQKRFEYEIGKKLRPIARAAETLFYIWKKHG